jgi:hypothetical protein
MGVNCLAIRCLTKAWTIIELSAGDGVESVSQCDNLHFGADGLLGEDYFIFPLVDFPILGNFAHLTDQISGLQNDLLFLLCHLGVSETNSNRSPKEAFKCSLLAAQRVEKGSGTRL